MRLRTNALKNTIAGEPKSCFDHFVERALPCQVDVRYEDGQKTEATETEDLMASDFNWRTRITDSLKTWFSCLQRGVDTSIYYTLCASVLWPVVQAFNSGNPTKISEAIIALMSAVGGNLVANRIEDLAKQKTVEDTARQLEKAVADEPALRDELNTLLEKLDVLTHARQVLSESERQWFVDTLREELQQSGNFSPFSQNVIFTGSIHADVTVNVFQSTADQQAKEALLHYQHGLFESCRRLSLWKLDREASDPTRDQQQPELARVYIDLLTTTLSPAREDDENRRERFVARGHEMLNALDAVSTHRHVVLLGDPGSGKSTFLNNLLLRLVGHTLFPHEHWLSSFPHQLREEAPLLPIPVILRDFAAQLPRRVKKVEVGLLWDFIRSSLRDQNVLPASDLLERGFNEGRALLLLDGLDEITQPEQRKTVRALASAWASRYRNCRMIVTCRTLSYQEPAWQLAKFPSFTLAPFTPEQIVQFIDAWYAELARVDNRVTSSQARQLAEKLRGAVQTDAVRRSGLYRLAPNPLLLTVMALVHADRGLPDTRAQLYEDTVDMLLHRWDEGKTGGEQPLLRRLLAQTGFANTTVAQVKTKLGKLAYEVHGAMPNAEEETLADIQETDLAEALRGLHRDKSRDWAYKVIGAIKERSGLLLERKPGVYAFPHRTFQEYLAGAYLSTLKDFVKEACRLAVKGPVWREAILLAAGRLAHGSEQYWGPLGLVGELCPRKAGETDAAWRNAWLAGDVLLEIGGESVATHDMGDELLNRVRCRLVKLLQGGYLSPVERARAGDTVAELGDPRFSDDDLCLPNDKEFPFGFIEVPAGPFLMGSDKQQDPDAYGNELEQHLVSLPRYYIVRYPVTVAQFRAFVERSGYHPADKESLHDLDTHPVVNVTWYDVMAYCHWLTEQLRQWPQIPEPFATILREGGQVTLPSEAEWEKAARSTDGRLYPWGNEFEANKANMEETGINGTSAVGCFPKDVSPYSVMDLAGNVWEWTRSLWGKDIEKPTFRYPYDPNDGRENLSVPNNVLRVWRGGAFWNYRRLARCAFRNRSLPNARNDDRGFRVVVLPKNSGL